MDLHSPHTPRNMAVVFEPSHPPFWCKTESPALFHHHIHDPPSSSAFYNLAVPFMGPTRRPASVHRADPTDSVEKVPRPPNAWILYRSDKLKGLPPPPPGMPRRPQADISKTISAMWKAETPEIRARYERLSDIKKAEHLVAYPDYRFQPMKKAEKERLKAEKLAEKERERITRKAKARTRASTSHDLPPLYTTEARFGPAGPSPPASAASTPPVGQSGSQQLPPTVLQLTPPADHPTPPTEHSSTPMPPTSTPTPYPPPPSATSIPPLAAPQPGVPQRPPSASDWPHQQQHTEQNEQHFNALWLEQGPLPDMSQFASSQEYLTVPIPNHPPQQQPLGWSPNDPSPPTDLPFYNGDPLHAVISPTDDPNVFDLGEFDFDVNEFFDGSREIEVSMGSSMMASFGSDNQFQAFTSLLANLDPPQYKHSDPSMIASSSQQAQSNEYSGTQFNLQSAPTLSTGFDNMGSYSFDSFVDEQGLQGQDVLEVLEVTAVAASETLGGQAAVPYAPPAGASNSSNRRVAAEWRHIQRTPEPEEMMAQVWIGNGH